MYLFFTVCNLILCRTADLGRSRSQAAKCAGAQVHRQRMGAIMGPTIVRQRFHVDTTGGGAPVKFMQKMLSDLEPLEKKIPPFKLEAKSAQMHIAKYKEWLEAFMACLGYKSGSTDNYFALHILRKHLIAQTILASNPKMKMESASEAEEALQTFTSKEWFEKSATMKTLRDLVPDEAEYLSIFASILKPWRLPSPYFIAQSRHVSLQLVTFMHFSLALFVNL